MQFGLFVKQLHCEPGIDGQQVGIVPNSHSTVPLRYRCLAKGFDKFLSCIRHSWSWWSQLLDKL